VAGKQERQRRLARERYERRLAREAERQRTVRRMTAWVSGGVVLLIVVGVVTFTLLRTGGKNASAQSTASASPSLSATTPAVTPSATPTPTAPAAEPATRCDYVASGTPSRPVGGLPPAKPDNKASYQATIKTNRGDVVIDLLNSKATCTVNSFVFLAAKSFYNNTPCPRLSSSQGLYILQCGDPTGTGSGGPGYEFYSENLSGATYPAGTVAMANSGLPYSNGSQFFLVYQNTTLSPNYTPFGRIVSGLSVLQNVAKAGIGPPLNPAGGGTPKEKVVIESVIIKKT
jgi:peptidyl-prolyl cis-trans isomerase B (cyclophilin B)